MPNRNINVGIVCGGPSPEADVSRLAAGRLAPTLQKHYKQAFLLELDENLAESLKQNEIDLIVPATYGPLGEDGCLQGMLDILGVPYVGSDVAGSACSLNKIISKRILACSGLPLARDRVATSDEPLEPLVDECIGNLGHKVIIKPVSQGSGIGVQFAEGRKELTECLKAGFALDHTLLIEEFITGREITAGVLDTGTPEVTPVVEITTPNNAWYSYEHRYNPGMSNHIIPAPIPEAQYKRVQEIALKAHILLGCRDISRSDFLVPESGEPIFCEINNLPGMTPTSLFPDAAKHAGIAFDDLICRLVDHAYARGEQQKQNNKTYWPIPELAIKPGQES